MEGFDWVTSRALCSPGKVFEKLYLQVKEDVEARNKLLAASRDAFYVEANNSRFSVSVPTSPLHPRILFSLVNGETIMVEDGKGKLIFEATLTLNDQGECRLKVNGQEREFWQVRRMALEDLFFPS